MMIGQEAIMEVNRFSLEGKDKKDDISYLARDAMLFGRGDYVHRAWVFMLLARQENLARLRAALVEQFGEQMKSLDSVAAAIGIDTTASQFCRTRRDRPLPSEPTTMTTGPVPS